MQYQVYKADTGEIVAWIDTNDDKGTIIKSGYGVKAGNELRAYAEDEDAVRKEIYTENKEGR